ncbi:MAG TPA: trehalose-phosphatase, partial [Prolixibacteraceae bacterium]|nr:trehalose-phosphatase [Prolixibacteraceae bacterium]
MQQKVKAVILDMDGVITQTAKIHKDAWKQMFNDFLKRETDNSKLMSDEDYVKYLDGKPRYKGAESFLTSRNIDLPFGDPEDSPDEKTICGLGNRKNEIYSGMLKERGANVYKDAVEKIKLWKENGLKTAVVTSSKNGKLVLETAGIEDLFDVRIDGLIAKERELKGKPNPDIFVEATKELGVSPENCALFEDAISGVQSGSNGNFALVVGVARQDNRKELAENGADVVIESFAGFDLLHDKELAEHFTDPAPPLFSEYSKIEKAVNKRTPVLFLDYDGTLTPIVKRPEAAVISNEMKSVLEKCAGKFKVAAVSGRDMDDLKDKIKLENLIYAGSHGFRITGPDGLYKEHDKSEEILPKLDQNEKKLKQDFSGIDKGIQIERKRYAIAVHYRNAREESVP